MISTPVSLLERLKIEDDHQAWELFVQLYTPFLFQCARQFHLSDADASDLVQDVFILLLEKMNDFEYSHSGSFRGWLKTVTLNKFRETRRKKTESVGDDLTLDHPIHDDELNRFWDAEYADYVVARAMELMQANFEPKTWQACWQHIVEGRPATEVAENLGLTVTAVYTYSSRVLKRLREELKDLMD